jgi:HPt (histidine-containing phosphotransfer) domain-containing protein
MIIYENKKIIGISKKLLQTLNIASLEEIPSIINQFQLDSALLNKKSINILNKEFIIKKEDLFTLKDLEIYLLIPIQDNQSENNDLLNLSTKNESQLQMPEINVQDNQYEISQQPIELSFEDNITKCEKIFKEKGNINEIIKEEVDLAKKELGIDDELAQELLKELLDQIINKKDELYKAIKNKDYEKIHRIAHYLKGSALNLRLSKLAFIFKTIDEESKKHTDIETIKSITDKLFDFISPLFEKDISIPKIETNKNKSNITIDPKIKNFVMNTIRYYLEKQDEKRFERDKEYLERLLHIKINSLEDLKDLEEFMKDKK